MEVKMATFYPINVGDVLVHDIHPRSRVIHISNDIIFIAPILKSGRTGKSGRRIITIGPDSEWRPERSDLANT